MEDHRDIAGDPFGFLQMPHDSYSHSHQTLRGNRLTKSSWRAEFAKLGGSTSRFLYAWERTDRNLPEQIDESIDYEDESDLRFSHIGVMTTKS